MEDAAFWVAHKPASIQLAFLHGSGLPAYAWYYLQRVGPFTSVKDSVPHRHGYRPIDTAIPQLRFSSQRMRQVDI